MQANTEATGRTGVQRLPRAHVQPPLTNLDIMQDDASASLVLEGQEFLSVLSLLVAVLLEEMGEAVEGHIIPGEVESLEGVGGGDKAIIRGGRP